MFNLTAVFSVLFSTVVWSRRPGVAICVGVLYAYDDMHAVFCRMNKGSSQDTFPTHHVSQADIPTLFRRVSAVSGYDSLD